MKIRFNIFQFGIRPLDNLWTFVHIFSELGVLPAMLN